MNHGHANKVVIAPDKFKGSLTASQAADAIQRGVRKADRRAVCVTCPMADGGEGTVDAFLERGAVRKVVTVRGPLVKSVEASYALCGDAAILEMASASGLALLEKSEYDPLHADTFGTGELIAAALDANPKRLIIGIGGSATNDAGTGMLRALGVRFLNEDREEIDGGVQGYERLAEIDLTRVDKRIFGTDIAVAVDVDNPLCGPNGATYTFAAQKGARPEQLAPLDHTLSHIADIAARALHHDYRNEAGAGAAGGLGFALMAFLGATVVPGVQLIARECGLNELLKGASLCITGEGKIDEQTLHGKVVFGVGNLAREQGVPVIAFGGAVDRNVAKTLNQRGIEALQIAPEGTPVEESIRNAAHFLQMAAQRAAARSLGASGR